MRRKCRCRRHYRSVVCILLLAIVVVVITVPVVLIRHTPSSTAPSSLPPPPFFAAAFNTSSITPGATYSWQSVDSTDTPSNQRLHHGLLSLDGTLQDYVNLAQSTGPSSIGTAIPGHIGGGSNGWSFEAVFKQASVSTYQYLFNFAPQLATQDDTTCQNAILLATYNMKGAVCGTTAGSEDQANQALATNSDILANTWQHVVFVLQPDGTYRLYQQGVQVGIAYNMVYPISIARPMSCLGCSNVNWANPYFTGLIDTFNIYNTALTGEQIRTLWRRAMVPETPPTPTVQSYDQTSGQYWWRPWLHYSPRINFINDPNGLIFDPSTGLWHLFSQYWSSSDQQSGRNYLNWGHAVSYDLVNWTEYGIAIPRLGGVSVYSGTAVFDYAGTSGLCVGCMIAIYAGDVGGGSGTEDVRLAYNANGDGETFVEYANNPVINPGEANFRDPSVAWHTASAAWVAAVYSDDNAIQFYRSPNLKTWTLASTYTGMAGECPNWFPMTVVETGVQVWVLKISYPVAPGYSWYQVGSFDGHTFSAFNPSTHLSWDQGYDFYSDQTFANAPDNRRIVMGWMAPEGYAFSTAPWECQYSIPRELTMHQYHDATTGNALYVAQGVPVPELAAYRTHVVNTTSLVGSVYEVYVEVPTRGPPITVYLRAAPGPGGTFSEYVSVTMSTTIPFTTTIDRRFAGSGTFDNYYNVYTITPPRVAEMSSMAWISLRLLVDKNSLEVFVLEGLAAGSFIIFPTPNIDNLYMYMNTTSFRNLTVWSYE